MSDGADRRSGLAAVATLLVLSGAGSLALEVVWSRLLKLVFGSTTLAVSTILVAYMAGLGIGGLFGGRLASRFRNGVRAYGAFELAVGVYALAVPAILGAFPWLEREVLGTLPFWPAALLRFVLSLAVLFPPTFLMGATLPVLVGALAPERSTLARRVGLLYGLNTLGAVAGALVTTFVLFPTLGLAWTNTAGALFDLAAGALALVLAARTRPPADERTEVPVPVPDTGTGTLVGLVAYGVVGFSALVYEVTWTRTIAMAVGSSVHAFAAMLAAFLAGIALGSLAVRRFVGRVPAPLAAFGGGIALLALAALSTVVLAGHLPGATLKLYVTFGPTSAGSFILAGFVVSVLVMLAPTLVLGALFPLASHALAGAGGSTATTVGRLYFVNTLGSALGAFAAGFVLIPHLGLRSTLAAMVALDLAAAAAVLFAQREWSGTRARVAAACTGVLAAVVLIVQPGWSTAELTRGVYYRPRINLDAGLATEPLAGLVPPDRIAYYRDGLNTTVSVHESKGDVVFRSNGKPDASLTDMTTQVLLAQVPALFTPSARNGNAMVIGLASGTTAGSLALHPFRSIDVLEIEPAAVEASHFFDAWNNRPLARPNVRLVLDDGRNWLARTKTKYDLIVSEPSNPFITGVANLFTREFFRSAHRALAPKGRLCQWVQLYGLDPDAFRALLAAVSGEFPHVYAFHPDARYSDLILLAGDEPLSASDLPRWEALTPEVRLDLERIQVWSTADLWSLVRLGPDDVKTLAASSRFANTDDSMFVELRGPLVITQSADDLVKLFEPFDGGSIALAKDAATPAELWRLATSYRVQRGEPRIANRVADLANERGGDKSAEAAVFIGVGNYLKNDRGSALPFFASHPESFEPLFWCARVLYEMGRSEGRPEEALAKVNAALTISPGDWRALNLRLQIANALGRFDAARRDADALLASPLAPFFPDLLTSTAQAAAGLGRYDVASRELQRHLERQLDSPEEWTLLGEWLARAGDANGATIARENARRATRNQIVTLHRQARRSQYFGNRPKAIELLRRILKHDPGYTPAREDLARLGVD